MFNLDSNPNCHRAISANTRFKFQNFADVEVIFGTPKRNCDGVGICRLLAAEFVRVRWKCPSARAYLYPISGGGVCLRFDRQRLPQEYQDRYFRDQIFRVEEDFHIPQSLISVINMTSFTIVSGEYSVKVSERFLEIFFKNN